MIRSGAAGRTRRNATPVQRGGAATKAGWNESDHGRRSGPVGAGWFRARAFGVAGSSRTRGPEQLAEGRLSPQALQRDLRVEERPVAEEIGRASCRERVYCEV